MSNMRDGPVLKAVADVVKDHVGKAFASLSGKINEIEQRIKELPEPEKGEPGESGMPGTPGKDGDPGKDGVGTKGDDGAPGKDAPPVDVEALAQKVLALVPKPKDGDPGPKGKDADPIDTEAVIKAVLAQVPVPKDGLKGKDAEPVDTKALADEVLTRIPVPSNGKDADPIDTVAVIELVTRQVLEQVPAPIHGKDGKDGFSVDLDAVRVLVAGEVNKAISALPKPEPGRDGRPGMAGTAGINGKDAADIDPLDGIDESSAYPRGQWATHRGGLIYAYRTTDPVQGGDLRAAGWRVVVDGVSDIVKSLSPDERTEITTHLMTSGKAYTTENAIPNIIYRGTYKEGEHQRGDAVTQAGSLWIANARTHDRPGISKAWTLAVKRGSDGKDLNGTRQ